ncbi:MAG TPA: tetratricopeptide repeat protein [Xanthobacteraceae bacterium]
MIAAIRNARTAWLLALLFAVAPASYALGAEPKPVVQVVAFGLFGDQNVFESEAKGAAQIVASRFGGNPVIVRSNSKSREEATSETLAATLQSAAKAMDVDHDILLLVLTSHGSRAGIAVKTPSRQEILSPLDLFTMLDATHVRHRIVIVSACYSGVFIPPLADPDTLVITAADADHPSFGCRNGNAWTYFGDAFFNTALRRTANLREAFALASAAVRKRETQNHFEPSNPQIAGGENIERMLGGEGAAEGGEAARLDARYAPALAGRGDAYGGKGDFDRAIVAYNEAIRLDPRYARAYADRGLVYRAKGDFDRAMADSNQALTLDPKLAAGYNVRGMAYFSKGDKDRAITDYNEAIRLDPKRYFIYTNRGMAFAAKGDNDRAIADYNEAVKIEPKYFGAYYERGIAFAAKSDNDHAIADFNVAIKLNPKFSSAFDKRGLAYRAKGDNTRAEADLKEATRLKASGPEP